jgi:hypothetical protein
MSFYPKEGEPLWSKYSTQAVIHTMEVYSRFSFDYPYPVGAVGQRTRGRHGVPHDHLQRAAHGPTG